MLQEGTTARSQARVAIIGGGLAGLAASVEILRNKGSVIIVEKSDRLGGNSAKASSGINAAMSKPQAEHSIEDSLIDFTEDTIRSGKGLSRADLVDLLVANSASAIDFLQDFNIDLSSIARLGGHSHARTHRAGFDGKAMNVGYRIMSSLSRYLEDQPSDKVQIMKKSRATQVLFDDLGRVKGVRLEVNRTQEDGEVVLEIKDIAASSVVLATGGFCADRTGLLAQYVPSLKGLATTNGPFATGDGVRLGVQAGAGLVDMDQVQLHPTAFVNPADPSNPTKFLAPEALRGCGGILLNQKGRRFVNELDTRDKVVAGILQHCEKYPVANNSEGNNPKSDEGSETHPVPTVAYLVLNTQSIQSFDPTTVEFYVSRGLIQKFANAAELSARLSLPGEEVNATLESYGHTVKTQHLDPREMNEGMFLASESSPQVVDPFGKPVFPNLFSVEEELYVALVTPALHYCMGGLKFDTEGRILKDSGAPIPGLYGAGEVTGGVHGGNRLAGNSLLECVVFGRVAGNHAWGFSQEHEQSCGAEIN